MSLLFRTLHVLGGFAATAGATGAASAESASGAAATASAAADGAPVREAADGFGRPWYVHGVRR